MLPGLVFDDGTCQIAEFSTDTVDADVVLDSVVVKPFEPYVTGELTVCNQTFDAVTSEQSDEPLHDVDSLLEVGVLAFGQESEQDGERHMIICYAQY